MGEGELTPSPQKSFTEIFEEACPYYMAMGMSYVQFWEEDPRIAVFYRKADEIQRKRRNQELWLEGIYMSHALNATVGNMFRKGNKEEYPNEPIPITVAEQAERKEREQKARMERLKAAFTAKALQMNARMGGTQNADTGSKTGSSTGSVGP